MPETHASLLPGCTTFDDWVSITIAVYIALMGYSVMVAIPAISTAWVGQLGLGYSSIFILYALASLTTFGIYLFMYLKLRKLIPALADAS